MDSRYSLDSQRLDKWLKTARLFKSRKRASDACNERQVKINDVSSKASRTVVVGDEIVIRMRGKYRSFKVLGISKRNLSAKDARELYTDMTHSSLTSEQRELAELSNKMPGRSLPRQKGRPTKKTRRELIKLKNSTVSDGH